MRISQFAISNPQFAFVLVAALALLGFSSFLTMPRAEDPQFDFPFVSIVVSYPGTSPFDMETLVADPIEEAIKEVEELDLVDTEISNGLVLISAEFLYGADPDDKYDEVVQALSSIRADLPAEIHRLEIKKGTPSDVNMYQVALLSETTPYLDLERLADELEKRFDRVAGVKETEVWAIPEQQVQLHADLQKMQQFGIGFSQLVDAVRRDAENLPGGHVDIGSRRLSVTTSGDFDSLEEIRRTVVGSKQGRLIRVENLAEVSYGDGFATHLARQESRRAVYITAIQQHGANIFAVTRQLQDAFSAFAATLPAGVEAEAVFDLSQSVRRSVDGFFSSLLQGIVVVGVIVMLALGLRSAGIVMAAVPLSLLLGLVVVDLSDFALQQMSIMGLVVVLGLLVDNAIVVVENVNRYLQLGHRARDAALAGASEVSSAVTSGTLTTVLAFLPLALLPNNTGTFMRSMPVTVIATLFASLLVALTVTPMMASRYLGRGRTPLSGGQVTVLRAVLKPALRKPVLSLMVAVVVLLASLSLFPLVGTSLFPPSDKPMFLVDVELPAGSTLAQTDDIVARVESLLATHPEVEKVSANIGRASPRVFYNEFGQRESPSYGQLFVQIAPAQAGRVNAVVAQLREQTALIPGARVRVRNLRNGPPVDAPVAIRLVGDELDLLRQSAAAVEQLMRETPGTINVENPIGFDKVDLRVEINRDKAAMLGVALSEIDRVVRASLVGLPLADYRDEYGEDYTIVGRLAGSARPSVEDFRRITVAARDGMPVPLEHLATLRLHTEFDRFMHRDLRRAAMVTGDVLPDYEVAEVTAMVLEGLQQLTLPPGIRYEVSGEQEESDESFAGIFQAVVVAVFGIFAVLVLQFRSFRQPLIIFVSLPFALTGALLSLYLSGNSLSFMAAIGLTSLAGIVVNNAIILVDFANRLIERGAVIQEAVIEAACTRARPILITTLTTVGSLLPMTLAGSPMYAPMGWVIIGGLLVSTVLTLLLVPVLYVLLGSGRPASKLELSTAGA